MYVPADGVRHLDDLIRTDLQNLRDSYFFWLLMSSLAVALGVILEGPELAYETAAVIRPSRNGKRKKPLWITWVALVGWLFVVIGVAGEGVAEALVSKADGLIQTFNDIVLAAAERESAVAELRAGQAEQRAAEANAKADGFRLQISVSQEQAVKAEKESAQARLDLEKFKAPRTLTPKQRENLIAAIQRFSGQKFSLQVTDNPESLKFMQLLREALLSAGWVRSPSQVGDTELDGAGVTIDSGIKVGVTYDACPNNPCGCLGPRLSATGHRIYAACWTR